MDKIYTRKRIKIPSLRYIPFQRGKKSLKQKITLNIAMILVIALITLAIIINSITPIIDRVCEDAARAKATIVSNNMATEVMRDYTYNDLVNIYKDEKRQYNNATIKYNNNKSDNIRCSSKNSRKTYTR